MKATDVTKILNAAQEKIFDFKAFRNKCHWNEKTKDGTLQLLLLKSGSTISLNFAMDRQILVPVLFYNFSKEDLETKPSDIVDDKFAELKKRVKDGGLEALGVKSNTKFGKEWKRAK